jgi:hypothetical protein
MPEYTLSPPPVDSVAFRGTHERFPVRRIGDEVRGGIDGVGEITLLIGGK